MKDCPYENDERSEEMSLLWAYDQDICDGDYCPCNCDICRKAYDREVVTDDEDGTDSD